MKTTINTFYTAPPKNLYMCLEPIFCMVFMVSMALIGMCILEYFKPLPNKSIEQKHPNNSKYYKQVRKHDKCYKMQFEIIS